MPWERKPAEAPSNLEFNLSVVEAVHITHPLEKFVAVHDGNEALGEIGLVSTDRSVDELSPNCMKSPPISVSGVRLNGLLRAVS